MKISKSVTIDADMIVFLERLADRENRSVNKQIVHLIEEQLRNLGYKPKKETV